jgi:uncharacterized protein
MGERAATPTRLLSIADCDDGVTLTAWQRDVFASFRETIADADAPFPCFFARRALVVDTMRLTFLEDPSDDRSLHQFAAALGDYASICRELTPYTAFVAFFAPERESRDLETSGEVFWRVLQWLHDHDPVAWPQEIPTDPDEQLWEFCFAGEPFFVLGSTPAYATRRSRVSDTLAISFQPRFMFDKLIAEPSKLTKARAVIRRRVHRLDGIEVHPMINMYHEHGNREWRQYFVPDDNRPIEGRCPLRTHRQPDDVT